MFPSRFPKIYRGVGDDGFVQCHDLRGVGGMSAVAHALFPGRSGGGGQVDWARKYDSDKRNRERAVGASRRRCDAAAAMTGPCGLETLIIGLCS